MKNTSLLFPVLSPLTFALSFAPSARAGEDDDIKATAAAMDAAWAAGNAQQILALRTDPQARTTSASP